MQNPRSDRTRRPDHLPALDGLRGFAVVAVLAYHLGRLPGGFVGVDVFFVLSGFLVTRLLLVEVESTGNVSLGRFWLRRIRRLLPAMALAAVATLWLARPVLEPWRLRALRIDAFAAIGFVANWRFIGSGQSYFDSTGSSSPLRHTWSLGLEQQFYLLWPLLVLLAVALARRNPRRGVAVLTVLVAVLSAAWMAIASTRTEDLSRLYYGTDTRILAMAVGGLVATVLDRIRARNAAGDDDRRRAVSTAVSTVAPTWIGLGGIIVLMAAAGDRSPWMYRWGFALTAVVSAVAILGLGTGGGVLGRSLARRLPRWVGVRSYGIYLFSWPTQVLFEERFPHWSRGRLDVVTVTVTVAVAVLSHELVERPILEGRSPWRRRAGVRPAGAGRGARPRVLLGVAVLAVVAISVGARGAAPEPDFLAVDEEAVMAEALAPGGFDDASSTTTTSGAPTTTPAAPDTPFDPDAPLLVTVTDRDPAAVHGRPLRLVLIGDSVPVSFGLDAPSFTEYDIEVQNRALYGCSLFPHDWRFQAPGQDARGYWDACSEQDRAERLAFESGTDVVVMWFGAWDLFDHIDPDGNRHVNGTAAYERVLAERVRSRVDRARAAEVPLLIVLPPCFGGRAGEQRGDEALEVLRSTLQDVAANHRGRVRLLDPMPVLCPDGERDLRLADGTPVRSDGMHFSAAGAEWFWNGWFAGAVASAFPTR